MALIYVATNGNDATGTGTSAKPYRTIAAGIAASGTNGEIVVRAGTYSNEGGASGLAPKSGTTIRAETYPTLLGPIGDPRGLWTAAHSVIIDQGGNGTSKRGFYCAGKSNVTIIGFEIRNAFNGVEFGGSSDNNNWNTVRACHIYDCSDNGISTTSAMQLTIDGNQVHDCCPRASGRSNISVLRNRISAATLAGGYHVRITNNCSHHSMRSGGNSSDANGIIVDKMQHFPDMFAGMRVLVQGNYCWGSRGPGIKIMASRQVDVLDNTSYNNFRIKKPPYTGTGTSWGGDLVSQNSNKNTWRRNIGVATGIYGANSKSGGFANVGQSNGYEETWPLTGNTIQDNLFFGYDKDGSGGDKASTDFSTNESSAQGPSAETNKMGTALGLTSAAGIFVAPDANPPDFRVKVGSPAYNGVGGTQHIGAWKGTVVPVDPLLEKDTDPVMEILGDTIGTRSDGLPIYPVGATVRFKAGTYRNGPPTSVTHTVEWWNGSAYEAKTATVSGPSSGWYTFTAPSVSKQGGLHIKEVAVKGSVTLTTTSNWIDIAPQTITNTPPTNSVPPSISGTAAVGSTLSRSIGTWAGDPTPTHATQWKAGGANIAGATGASYTPVTADIGKVITVAVAGTNSEGTLTVTSAATAAVVDTRPPDDLTGLTRRMEAVEAKSGSQGNDITTLFGLVRDIDTALKNAVTTLGNRIGAVETETGGLPARVEELEAGLSDLQLVLGGFSDLEAAVYDIQQRIEDVERVVVRFASNGRLRLHPKA